MNKYQLFALFYNFFRIFPVKNNKVSFIGWREVNHNGNLGQVQQELDRRNNFHYHFIYKDEYSAASSSFLNQILTLTRLFLVKSYHLATSHYIFLSDNFLPLAYMNPPSETTIVQLWHASGAFKKFGLSAVSDTSLRKLGIKLSHKLDLITVSSRNVVPHYQEAFGVEERKVMALGVPRTDFYFKNNNEEELTRLRASFEEKYPTLENKKIVLYAPTFRDDPERDQQLVKNFNVNRFNQELGSEYVLMIRLHPLLNQVEAGDFIDVTFYPDEKELLLVADILVTDYSSIMIEYALLNKPIIFFPYDYEYYINEERGFYFDYEDTVPGSIAYQVDDLVNIIKKNNYDLDKLKQFVASEFDRLDGKASQRIVDHVIK